MAGVTKETLIPDFVLARLTHESSLHAYYSFFVSVFLLGQNKGNAHRTAQGTGRKEDTI